MIRYLQGLRRKKGFTIVELIVVVAIIGVLIAIIVPNMTNKSAKAQAATTAAQNFYSAVQYSFTKYSKTEAELSLDISTDASSLGFIKYIASANGNYPVITDTYIEMKTDRNGDIEYLHLAASLSDLLSDTSKTDTNVFARVLKNDIGSVFHTEQEGYYFACVSFADASPTMTATTNTVRTAAAHFIAEDLPTTATVDATYANNNLMFADFGELSGGIICGTCSSAQISGKYMGDIGTYFLNKGDGF